MRKRSELRRGSTILDDDFGGTERETYRLVTS